MSETSSTDQQQGQFAIQRVYVKDLSFEVPNAPKVFQSNWQPQINVQLSTEATALEGSFYEVVLGVTVTANLDDNIAFIAEIKQAGIFLLDKIPEDHLAQLLGAYCPNILFPFAREAIADVVARGSFPQLLLAPVNFDLVFAERQRQLADSAQTMQ